MVMYAPSTGEMAQEPLRLAKFSSKGYVSDLSVPTVFNDTPMRHFLASSPKGDCTERTRGHTRVKICGITCRSDLDAVANLGADAVGFLVGAEKVLANGQIVGHRVSIPRLIYLIDNAPKPLATVILIHTTDTTEILHLCEQVSPAALQLQVDFSAEQLKTLRSRLAQRLIASVHISPASEKDEIVRKTAGLVASGLIDAVLLDTRKRCGTVYKRAELD